MDKTSQSLTCDENYTPNMDTTPRSSQERSSLAPYLHDYSGGDPEASPDFYNDLSLTPPPPPPSRPRSTTSSESSFSHVSLRPCSSYSAAESTPVATTNPPAPPAVRSTLSAPPDAHMASNVFDGLLTFRGRSFKEKCNKLVADKKVSPLLLGKMMRMHECGAEYDHFVATRCKDVRVDVQEAKRLQDWTLKVPESSDSIVRELTRVVKEQSNAIVGLSSLVDALYNTCSDLNNQLHQANASISKVARRKLPEGTKLCHGNLTRPWRVEANPPFKAHDLNALLEDWERMKRVKDHEHYIQLVDFLRFYFVKATHPTPAIQSYSCRLTGKHAKNPDLLDLPHDIAHTLTEFLLDGLTLGHEEIINNTAEYLMSHPTDYWTKLGRDNESRKAALNLRKEYRSDWAPSCRGAIARALGDVRGYIIKESGLKPRPKRRRLSPDDEQSAEH